MLCPRGDAATLADLVAEGAGKRSSVVDMTGSVALLRLVGPASMEVIQRTVPLHAAAIPEGEARGTTIAGATVLVIREQTSVPAWLVLAPRSLAADVARELADAVRSPVRLDLFGTAVPPV